MASSVRKICRIDIRPSFKREGNVLRGHLSTAMNTRPGVSDDDLLLQYFFSQEDVAALKVVGPPKAYGSAKHPLLMLLESLIKEDHRRQIYLRTGAASIQLEKRKEKPTA